MIKKLKSVCLGAVLLQGVILQSAIAADIVNENFGTVTDVVLSTAQPTNGVSYKGFQGTVDNGGTVHKDAASYVVTQFVAATNITTQLTATDDSKLATFGADGLPSETYTWIELDLGSATDIGSFGFTLEKTGGAPIALKTFTSGNGTSWSEYSSEDSTDPDNETVYNYTGNVSGVQYIRLYVSKTNSYNPGTIWFDNAIVGGPQAIAVDDSYDVEYETELTVNAANGVLSNDTTLGNTVTEVTVPTATASGNGTYTIAADGSFSYTPNADFFGTDSFTYILDTATGTVTLNVADPTVAVDDYFSGDSGESPANITGNVLANDTNLEAATPLKASEPVNGSVTIAANGDMTYIPDANYVGGDSFTYTLGDKTGTVKINVKGLLAYYKLDDDSLVDALDVFNGTKGSMVTTLANGGIKNGAHDYSAVTAKAESDTIPSFNLTTDEFTMTAWIKVPASTSGSVDTVPFTSNNLWTGLFGAKNAANSETLTFSLRYQYTDENNYSYTPAVQFPSTYDNDFPSLYVGHYVDGADQTGNEDKWLFIAFVVSPDGYKVYLSNNNDELVSETSNKPVVPFTFDSDSYIGWSTNKSVPFKGAIDNVRFYNKALSADEINSDYVINTPAIGMSVEVVEDMISWTVEDEIDVDYYTVVKVVGGEEIEIAKVEVGEEYSVADVEGNGEKYYVYVTDKSGYAQPFSTGESTVVVDMVEGWNLISLPFDADLSEYGIVWGWDTQSQTYELVEEITANQGAWVYATNEELAEFTGEASDGTVQVNSGWNLVGPSKNGYAPSGVKIFGWDKAYNTTRVMTTGNGYWLKSDEDGVVELP